MIQSKILRKQFLDFMATKGHAILPSSSLVPKEDPTVLFNTAGMQPLVPYLMGQEHPQGTRLANSQKCLRTGDIEEVGDNRHCTFFEMLGSWSLGDYWKVDSIAWGFEFLTSKDWLGLDPRRLYVTVYKGSGNVPEDSEAIDAWKNEFEKIGLPATVGTEFDFLHPENNQESAEYIYRITKKSGKDNWWGLPYRGPCGPCTEIYYLLDKHEPDFCETILPTLSCDEADNFLENEVVEIWNHVFMQYVGEQNRDKEPIDLEPLAKPNIDTGMGFERILTVLNGNETVYQTDLLQPLVQVVERYQKQ